MGQTPFPPAFRGIRMSRTEPTRRSIGILRHVALFALVGAFSAASAFAQPIDLFRDRGDGLPGLGATKAGLKIDAALTAERPEPGAAATLAITVTIPEGFHLYSMDPGY